MARFPHLKEGTPKWAIASFFKKHPPKKPLLIALSGGADSMALYSLLQWVRQKIPMTLIALHVNHKVRLESDHEERYLKQFVASHGDQFFSIQLKPIKKNFEEVARVARYNFFLEMSQQLDADGCFLAHHADDVIETVLKRFFEGGAFESFKAMEPISYYQGLRLYRPLLSISKEQLLEMKIPHFIDETNLNGSNLRAKMRREIIPALETSFGKKIDGSILRISKEAKELSDYLESLYPNFSTKFLRRDLKGSHPFLVRQYLRKWLNFNNLTPTNDQLDKLREALLSSKSGQTFFIGGKKVEVGRLNVSIELV